VRKSPSLTSLRAFEAVARLGSITRAAQELCVTPAAISHRLRELEREAGAALVERRGGIFVASTMGRRALFELGDSFARIASTFAVLGGVRHNAAIQVTAPTSLAVMWLLPRLPLFEESHPDSLVNLKASEGHESDTAQEWDVIIRFAKNPPTGTGWRRLFADRLLIVAKPGHRALSHNHPEELLDERLLYVDWNDPYASPRHPWSLWAEQHGIDPARLPDGRHSNHAHMAARQAEQGRGVALSGTLVVADALADGRLCAMPNTYVRGISYWIWSNKRSSSVGTRSDAFVDWIERSIADPLSGLILTRSG
jgi:DNA-binding transcriptional LysR family regulator